MLEERSTRLVHLASFCNVSETTAHRWMTGAHPIPDPQKLRVAEFFGVTRAYLMGWDSDFDPKAAA